MPLVAMYVSSSSQAKSKTWNWSSTRPVGSIIETLGAAPEAPASTATRVPFGDQATFPPYTAPSKITPGG
jgi:hypothetical protein